MPSGLHWPTLSTFSSCLSNLLPPFGLTSPRVQPALAAANVPMVMIFAGRRGVQRFHERRTEPFQAVEAAVLSSGPHLRMASSALIPSRVPISTHEHS